MLRNIRNWFSWKVQDTTNPNFLYRYKFYLPRQEAFSSLSTEYKIITSQSTVLSKIFNVSKTHDPPPSPTLHRYVVPIAHSCGCIVMQLSTNTGSAIHLLTQGRPPFMVHFHHQLRTIPPPTCILLSSRAYIVVRWSQGCQPRVILNRFPSFKWRCRKGFHLAM